MSLKELTEKTEQSNPNKTPNGKGSPSKPDIETLRAKRDEILAIAAKYGASNVRL